MSTVSGDNGACVGVSGACCCGSNGHGGRTSLPCLSREGEKEEGGRRRKEKWRER